MNVQYKNSPYAMMRLVAGLATLLLDDVGELLDLALGAEEGAELMSAGVWAVTASQVTLTRFLVSFLAFLSLELRSSSMTRFS